MQNADAVVRCRARASSPPSVLVSSEVCSVQGRKILRIFVPGVISVIGACHSHLSIARKMARKLSAGYVSLGYQDTNNFYQQQGKGKKGKGKKRVYATTQPKSQDYSLNNLYINKTQLNEDLIYSSERRTRMPGNCSF